MSYNQSRTEKSEPPQYRRAGRSGNSALHRNYLGSGVGKTGGSGNPPPSSSASFSSNRSFKKVSNAQGGQFRVSGQNVNAKSDSTASLAPPSTVQNGTYSQPPLDGASDMPVTGDTAKQNDAPSIKNTRGVPKSPSSNAAAPNTPRASAKAPGDASRPFPLQFGSISPGLMNGMQIPARTSSAPPNLDEQKRDQARPESLRTTPVFPPSAVSKQQNLPRKDTETVDNISEDAANPKPKMDVHVSVPRLPQIQTQNPSVHQIPGVHMSLPFHQPQLPGQFGGPNPQIQSQARTNATSLPMPIPMPLPMGNPPQVSRQVFVPGIQPHHSLQSPGILHHGQSLNFSTQMSSQLPPQLGNVGINIGPQYPQQQAAKFGGTRKTTVKITDPKTNEVVSLDKRADTYVDARSSHPNAPPQSQPMSSFPPAHEINHYPNSYNPSPLFYPSTGSLPMTGSQIAPGLQPARSSSQVVVKPPVSLHTEKVSDSLSSVSLAAVDKVEFPKIPKLHGEACSIQPHRDSEGISVSKQSTASGGSASSEGVSASTSSAGAGAVEESESNANHGNEIARIEVVRRSDSIIDEQKKPANGEHSLPNDQADGQAHSNASLPSRSLGLDTHLDAPIAKAIKPISMPLSGTDDAKLLSTTDCDTVSDATISKTGSDGGPQKTLQMVGAEAPADTSVAVEVPSYENSESKEEEVKLFLESLSITTKTGGPTEEKSALEATIAVSETKSLEIAKVEEPIVCRKDDDGKLNDLVASSTGSSGSIADEDSTSDNVLSRCDSVGSKEVTVLESGTLDQEFPCEITGIGLLSPLGAKDKPFLESNRAKIAAPRSRKKRKEVLKNADAQGTTSDLYGAYKGPEEKKDSATYVETPETSSTATSDLVSADANILFAERAGHGKFEPDDWEDAADLSTPKLESANDVKQIHKSNEGMTKKYSRDFLLKFLDQCNELPEGFEIASDLAEAVIASKFNVSRAPIPSPGRSVDRSAVGLRLDRRPSGLGEDERWTKLPSPIGQGRDLWVDASYGGNTRGQGGNYGVLRNPRAQMPVQYAGGILAGPMQSPNGQGVMQRNNSDSDRWQRGADFQKGLIPSPQTPLQAMHKADKKYEVGKVTDEEQAKQRQLKGILNKLTPQNFDKLFEQVKQVNIDNSVTLSGVISQIFDKALTEPTFCEMYADFCFHLARELPVITEDNEKITFRRLLLNKCQEEFERGEREQEEANRIEEEGEVKQSEEEREEKRIKARRRMLGNIRLIGELYKKKMLTERIMHECMKKLLGQHQNPDEEDVEALCKLMSTIGEMIDHPKAKEHIDAYFDTMSLLSNNMKLSSRVRFMLKDVIDLRKNKWQQRRKVEGPKKIEEVHRDAAQERQAQSSRLARGPGVASSVRRGQTPMDFVPRGSGALPSPNSQIGVFRGLPQQSRGYGNQDVRIEERHTFENRALSVPLRPMADDSITLGPQGGLARGMSIRGQPSNQNILSAGPNGYGSVSDRTTFSSREDLMPRSFPDIFGAPVFDQSSMQERNANYGTRGSRSVDHSFDRPRPISPQDASSEKVWPEERLRDMSMQAIKEFYSAKDEKEVTLCIKDLNAPSFYPSMVSIWVTDSFERKDMERELLAKLLVNLTKSQDGLLSQDQLLKGFESVLASLEDTQTDAPKATEFLGRIFARVILENAVPSKDVWQLIYDGGEEQGRLVEIGYAAEVLGVILEIIQSERGDSFLSEMRNGSNIHVANFRPPNSKKAWTIDKFV